MTEPYLTFGEMGIGKTENPDQRALIGANLRHVEIVDFVD